MNVAFALVIPFTLLLPAVRVADDMPNGRMQSYVASQPDVDAMRLAPSYLPGPVYAPDTAFQIRIERRMTIRITPYAPAPIAPERFLSLPDGQVGPHYTERKIGDCLKISDIAAVQPDRNSRLLLIMRDNTLVSAQLERSCRARDFYLGFYMRNTADGRLCVKRDQVLSRSGMSCGLTRIRLLVPARR